jgi:hypothetical protein
MAIIRASNGYTHKVSDTDLAVAMQEEEAWAKKLRQALVDKAAYDENTHRELAKEMEAIEARLGNYTGGTIFDHVRSIFDDAVIRGFQHDLHFPQLLIQYKRYGFGEPPEQWVPPPDVQSRDTSPVLFPAATQTSPHPTRSAPPGESNRLPSPIDAYRPATRARKTISNRNNPLLPSFQQPGSSTSGTEAKANWKETAVTSTKHQAAMMNDLDTPDDRPRDVPAGAIKHQPGCSRCRGVARACWVFHKNSKKVACYSCRALKMKCDVDGQVLDDDLTKEMPPPKKPRQPPRKETMALGEPGVCAGNSPLIHFISFQGLIPPHRYVSPRNTGK